MARLTSIFNWLIFIQIIDLIYLIKTKLIKRTFVWWMAFRCTDCRHAFCFLQFFSRTIFVLIFKHSFFSRVSFNLFLPFEDWFCCCKKFIVFLRFFAVSFNSHREKRKLHRFLTFSAFSVSRLCRSVLLHGSYKFNVLEPSPRTFLFSSFCLLTNFTRFQVKWSTNKEQRIWKKAHRNKAKKREKN